MIATIPLGRIVGGEIFILESLNAAYVSLKTGAIAVVDTTTNTVIANIPTTGLHLQALLTIH
ncbi:hypothetical protein [Mesobacillus zeae]|uniref:hypothetical protein n=1 Tax=Mesobacillus zeae TaxID=1917180 RepID=UPI00115D647B|nr:hypothetical protein [Mesobacillus zeae]